MVYPPHMLFTMSLDALIIVGSSGDCECYIEGCGGFWFYLLLLRLVGGGRVVVVRLGAGFVFVVGWVGE